MGAYKEMYLLLFRAITDVIETLIKVQLEAEQLYMDMADHDDA